MNTMQRDPGAHARNAAVAALKKLKARAYALDEGSALSLGAFVKAYAEKRGFNEILAIDAEFLLEQLLKFDFLALRQVRPQEPENIVWPIDPVTGERLPNPFDGGSLGDRNLVDKLSPALAKHLQRLAAEGPWKLYAEQLEQTAVRAEINAIKYDEAEHAKNPFRTDDRAAQAEFVKNHPAEVVNFYRREAEPVTLPWSPASVNRYHQGIIYQADRELGELVQRAGEIETQWLDEKRRMAEREAQAARDKVAELEGRLQRTPTTADRRAELAKAAAAR